MCWQCDNPDLDTVDYLAHVLTLIDRFGWFIQYVEPNGMHPPFGYTVGLHAHGHPELVVTGMDVDRTSALLNAEAAHAMHAAPPRPGECVELTEGTTFEVVLMPHPSAHLETAVALYGKRIQALQLVWADSRGTWPWEPGHRSDHPGGQPVLGARALRRGPVDGSAARDTRFTGP